MRPVRLEIEGLTSFRDRVALDFDGLDLFAITGPTGAGKSSLIDAMTLALFGQVPRVSGQYKQLISHGAERMSVLFDFRVGGETYRVARTIRATGSPAFRLERLTAAGSEPLADRDKDVCEEVERILGLDYDAFVRSVVLPQGQFDAFLKGKPEERRKILVSLLNLKVYEDMHAIVNRRATEARREADFIARQLEQDFAGATPERLCQLRRDLGEAEAAAARAEDALAALAEGVALARDLRQARRERERLEGEEQGEVARAAAANGALERAASEKEALERRLRDLAARVQATGFDEARLLSLAAVTPRLEQLAVALTQLDGLETDCASTRAALDRARAELAAAEEASAAQERDAEKRRSALEAVRAEHEALQRRHAAHALRAHLSAGEPCPVCEQPVRAIPKGKAPALALAEKAVQSAEAAAREAEACLQQARVALERRRSDAAAQEKQLAQQERQRAQGREAIGAQQRALAEAGFAAPDPAAARRLLSRSAAELAGLQKARAERDRIESDRKRAESDAARIEAAVAKARAQAEEALARLAVLQERREGAAEALEAQGKRLLARARREGWGPLDAPLLARDELDALEARQNALQKELSGAAARAARLRAEAERLENDIGRAAEKAERRQALEGEAALAATLAQHLQANQFIAYVQEEALRVLAADGSHHLKALSQGRYSLGCKDQDFYVVDHWNADRERSVKTLSGGETFLASLALALALAERLADLAAEGHAGDRLESLFLDEGFGTLDAETLDLVVQAIETLHGGNRLVGVVTHNPDLAERLPARVVVSGGQGVPAAVAIAG